MYIDIESLAILAGTYWMLYLAFTTTPSARDREHTAARRL